MAVFEELSSASEFEEQIANIQEQIDNLDDTYATDSDIQGLQGQIDVLGETVAGLGTGGSGASVKNTTLSSSEVYNFLTNNFNKVLYIKHKPTSSFSTSMQTSATTTTGTTFSTSTLTIIYSNETLICYPAWASWNMGSYEFINNNGTNKLNFKFDSDGCSLSCTKTFVNNNSLNSYSVFGVAYNNKTFEVTYIE